MKRSCSALQSSIPSSPELDDSGVSTMCFACSAVVDEPLVSSIQSFAVALFSCCEQAFVLMILVGQCGATLDLS